MRRRWLTILAFALTGLGGFAAGRGWKDWRLERCRESEGNWIEMAEICKEENRALERRLEEALK
jgi:hypothetical protein